HEQDELNAGRLLTGQRHRDDHPRPPCHGLILPDGATSPRRAQGPPDTWVSRGGVIPARQAAVTKSISRSTAVTSGVSTSRKLDTEPWILPHMAATSAGDDPTPSARHTPVFQSVPRGTSGQAATPTATGRTACQMSTKGWPS